MTPHLTSNKQKEAESKRKPPSEPICCTTTGRSAANSLAQTIGAASLSTREAQVKSTASPPHLRERRSQLRLARRRPEFYGQAHELRDLVQLPCSFRSDVAHAALNSAAAQAPVAHELVKEQACFSQACFRFFACFFFRAEGKGLGGARKEAGR